MTYIGNDTYELQDITITEESIVYLFEDLLNNNNNNSNIIASMLDRKESIINNMMYTNLVEEGYEKSKKDIIKVINDI